MPITKIPLGNKPPKEEHLRINKASRNIRFSLMHFKYRDKDTRQIVFYIPSLELTGYGDTEAKAKKMLDFSIDQLCGYLIDLPPTKLEKTLKELGWKHSKIKTKQYSKAYVDTDGNLKQFNAVGDSVEVGILEY